MESTMLVPQFPFLIVAKVRRELWPSLFFFMGSLNMPDLPRTDNVGIIMGNFVSYYRELYCDKPVNMPTLDMMIGEPMKKNSEGHSSLHTFATMRRGN